MVNLDGNVTQGCLSDFVFSGSGGTSLTVGFGDGGEPPCDDVDGDGVCDDVDDLQLVSMMSAECVMEMELDVECSDGSYVCDAKCPDDGTCTSQVCLDLDGGSMSYSSVADIAGFQFSHNGCVTGASGGDAAANGFTVSVSGSTVLAFSFTGAVIPW